MTKFAPGAGYSRFAADWPEFCMDDSGLASRASALATSSNQDTGTADSRAKTMKEDNGTFGIIVGGLVALAAVIFIFGGGELGGKTVINGDQDLPPIASADQ